MGSGFAGLAQAGDHAAVIDGGGLAPQSAEGAQILHFATLPEERMYGSVVEIRLHSAPPYNLTAVVQHLIRVDGKGGNDRETENQATDIRKCATVPETGPPAVALKVKIMIGDDLPSSIDGHRRDVVIFQLD